VLQESECNVQRQVVCLFVFVLNMLVFSVLLTTMVAATLHKGSRIITVQQPSFQTLQDHLSILCSYSVLAFRGGNGVGVPLAILFQNFL